LDRYYIGAQAAAAHSITGNLAVQLRAVLEVVVVQPYHMVSHVDHQAVIHQVD
jgi:hypothetical protein